MVERFAEALGKLQERDEAPESHPGTLEFDGLEL